MSQRTALLVATGLTVFVMILMVGVVWQVFQKSSVDTLGLQMTALPQTTEIAGASLAVSSPTQAEIAQREAAFQQLVQQANQRLEQANQQQQELTKELDQAKQQIKANQPAPAPQPAKYKVSPQQAVAIALAAVPGAVLTRQPELVSFQGAAAYEVTLDRGVVYVDPNSGKVLYNSAEVITVRDPSSGNGGGNNNTSNNSNSNGNNNNNNSGSGEHKNEHEQEHKQEQEHENEQEHG